MFKKLETIGAKVNKKLDEQNSKQKKKEEVDIKEVFQFGEKHPVLGILLLCTVGGTFIMMRVTGAWAFFGIAGYFLVKWVQKLIGSRQNSQQQTPPT
jgi:hypothetical protein